MADDIRALRAELAEISLLVGCVKETASIRQEVNSIAAEVEKIKKEAQNKGKATDGIKHAEEQKKQQEQARKHEEEKQLKAKKEEEERQQQARKKEEQRRAEEKQQDAKKQEQTKKQEEERKKEEAAKAAQAQAEKEKKEKELKAQQNKEAEEKKKREQEEKERLAQQQKAQQSQQAQPARSQPAPAKRSTSSSGPRTGGGTLCSDGNIFDAYDSVRADNTDLDWVVLTYENNSKLKLAGSGSGGIAKILPFCAETECCFAYVRVVLASDESRRAKFVLISWIGEKSPIMRKAKMSVHKAVVKEVFRDFSLELNATDRDDLAEARVIGALQKASGANYMGQVQR